MSIVKDGFKIPKNLYPFLDQISNFEKKPIVTDLFFPFGDADPQVIKMIEDFFKYPSLKDALKNTFGISSGKVCDFVNNNIIVRSNPKQIGLNLNFFLSLSTLYYVFLNQEKPNHDSFLKALGNHHVISILSNLYNHRVRLQGFMKNLTEDQKLQLLERSDLYDEVVDMINMYFQRDDYFSKILKDLPVERRDTFQKIHDEFAKHLAKIKAEDFTLLQEKINPKLYDLVKEPINKEFFWKVPQTHHDLIDWGAELGHCIGGRDYAMRASQGRCILLAIYKKEEGKKTQLKYTIEIINKRINQAQGVSGSRPNAQLLSDMEKALQKAGIF